MESDGVLMSGKQLPPHAPGEPYRHANRNVELVRDQFGKDPSKILVSIQLEDDQIRHVESGFTQHVRRRFIPLTVLAELIEELNSR